LKRGTVYLSPEIAATLPELGEEAKVDLMALGREKVSFKAEVQSPSILSLADAWHPQWKVFIDEKERQTLKVNGIFKGVLLQAGDQKVEFIFDTSPYQKGLYISLVAWSFFMLFLLWFWKRDGGRCEHQPA
jgi:uncharacterized membrane protein YfhO